MHMKPYFSVAEPSDIAWSNQLPLFSSVAERAEEVLGREPSREENWRTKTACDVVRSVEKQALVDVLRQRR